jgi:hypothetical protein
MKIHQPVALEAKEKHKAEYQSSFHQPNRPSNTSQNEPKNFMRAIIKRHVSFVSLNKGFVIYTLKGS